ncbi:hypothetical protein ACFSC6_18955 [Rufibacter sediminis]
MKNPRRNTGGEQIRSCLEEKKQAVSTPRPFQGRFWEKSPKTPGAGPTRF